MLKRLLKSAAAVAARSVLALAMLLSAVPAMAQEVPAIRVSVEDPRAFGHLVGDVLTRRVVLDVPRRLKLVDASLPVPGRIGQSFELRGIEHASRPTWAGTRHTLALRYQVFRAPSDPVVLDLPAFVLRFEGQPRNEELRIDFAPVGMVPLLPAEAVMRAGFGTLRPDVPAQAVDTRPERLRLIGYGLAALLPLGYLAFVYLGAPWWQRRQRPFALAQRQLQALPADAPPGEWLAAWRRVHAALDATGSEVLHAGVLRRWIDRHPRYAALGDELAWFFDRSQAIFFAGQAPQAAERERLRALCRRCFDVERGLG